MYMKIIIFSLLFYQNDFLKDISQLEYKMHVEYYITYHQECISRDTYCEWLTNCYRPTLTSGVEPQMNLM